MDLILVPYLLAAHVPPNTDTPPMYLESTFYGHVDSRLTIKNGYIENLFLINFTSNFICNATALNKLSCYINNPKLIVTSTIMSTANPIEEILRETTDIIPFSYINNTPIGLVFDPSGIMGYNITDDVHLSTDFLDLFLTITSQMNIGNFYVREKGPTRGWDTTYMGRCPTNYTVDHRFEDPNLRIPKYKFNLKSISNFELEDNKVMHIKKQRSLDTCHFLNDYMFGINHIKTSLPVHHRIYESTTYMQISIQDFGSTTDNRYKLYNQDEKEIGNAIEDIYLQLNTI